MMKLRRFTPPIPFFQASLFPIIDCGGNPCSLNDAEHLLLNALRFLWYFAGIVAALVVLWSAFQFITAAGDPTKAESARKTLFAGLIGAIIVVVGYAFTVIFARTVAGGDIDLRFSP